MARELGKRAYEIFYEALKIDEKGRGAFLRHACEGDDDLLREVESLFTADSEVSSFLGIPLFSPEQESERRLVGRKLQHYEIVEKLASGGTGEVYIARDSKLDRKVALKVLPEATASDPEHLERFEREARALAALNHPNIITIYSVEQIRDVRFFTMELVEGETLAKVIPKGGVDVDRFYELAVPLTDALSSAHERGIIHRDLKPANVMVGNDDRVKVLDFGLAKQRNDSIFNAEETPTEPLTGEGRILGTLPYMSPEQVKGRKLDYRSDIFSLGIILYEMLTGQKPFRGANPADLISSILRDSPQPVTVSKSEFPPRLDRILQKCLEKEPAKRYGSARQLRDELEALRTTAPAGVRGRSMPPAVRQLVGRQWELAQLQGYFDEVVADSRRRVLLVSGEAGIGKTALVETFLTGLDDADVWVAHGQCQELFGAGEAYLPVLEALERLCRRADGATLVRLLERHAPSWLVQMPGLVNDRELDALQRRVTGSTPKRMLREIAVALEAFTHSTPLVMVLEDLHWSDYSTLDLLSVLARRQEPARFFLIGSFRPTEVLAGGHPLRAVQQDLRMRGHCVDLSLGGLSASAVQESLVQRLAGQEVAPELAQRVWSMTEGNPLFLRNMVDHLMDRGWVREVDGTWRLRPGTGQWQIVPDNLRRMIQAQIESLEEDEQRLLEVGSVAGVEFSAAVTAAAMAQELSDLDDGYRRLAARNQFLRASGEEEWPDGTVAGRYTFIHALYQNVLYERLAASQRVRLHRRIGQRLEAAYGSRVDEIAAVLAVHFERGRDTGPAVKYLGVAARKAFRRAALREATDYLRKGLALLRRLPGDPERDRQELQLLTSLGAAVSANQGYAVPEVEEAFARVEELSKQFDDTEPLLYVLWGLWTFHINRGALRKCLLLARRLERVVESLDDPDLLLVAHTAMAVTRFLQGEPGAARDHLEAGIVLDSRERRSVRAILAVDAGVTPLCAMVQSLWHLGYPDQAIKYDQELIALANQIAHPFSSAFAFIWSARLHQLRGEVDVVRERAREVISLAEEHGHFWSSLGQVLLGWALAKECASQDGAVAGGEVPGADEARKALARMRRGLESYGAPGTKICYTYFLYLLAETYCRVGQLDDACQVIDEALRVVEASGERLWESELHRYRGELALLKKPEDESAQKEAEREFERALEISRSQAAKSLELRAALSLGRLRRCQGQVEAARQLVAGVYDWFQEGFETADLRATREFLQQV